MAALQVGDIKLDEVEARELLKKHQYMYFLSTANIVSLSYRSEKRGGKKTEKYVLHIGSSNMDAKSCQKWQGCHI